MDENENENVIGFLAKDGVFFCSRECGARHGATIGYEVDQDEYDALVENGSVAAEGLCPGCGAEFVVSWPEREPN
jgi:hypothetical protein